MKNLILTASALLTFGAYAQASDSKFSGPCALVAAQAAQTWAASQWQMIATRQKISFSNLQPHSEGNASDVQVYDVGIVRQDRQLVQFDSIVHFDGNECISTRVQFAEEAL